MMAVVRCCTLGYVSVRGVLALLFMLYAARSSVTHSIHLRNSHCNHAYPTSDQVVYGVHLGSSHTIKKRSVYRPLRILLVYDDSVTRLHFSKFALINNTILPAAVQYWEDTLMVRDTQNKILLNRKCENQQVFLMDSLTYCIDSCREKTMCGTEIVIPDDHLDICRTCNSTGHNCGPSGNSVRGNGVNNADFVFYVSAMQTHRCSKGQTVAYAAHCQQEAALDRPIAGHANICPDSISVKPQDQETLLSTVKHELLHALGFSASLYGFYRDDKGEPYTPRLPHTGRPPFDDKLKIHLWSEKVIKTITRKDWLVHGGFVTRTMNMMVTPRVVKEVRDYFNCDTLEGAELEDQGEEGTALTHWEKRVFENEAMTGTHTQNPVYSRITLALMEDTGWYQVNYSMAEPLTWGKGLGCEFVMKSCKEWMMMKASRGRSLHPFCNKVKRDPLQTECTDDRLSVALCNLVEYEQELPNYYQNFDYIPHVAAEQEKFYGGSVSLADYCPFIQEFTWRSKNVPIRGSHCQHEKNTPHVDKNFALEEYGSNSKCFEHTNQMWEERSCGQVRQWRHWGSGCYRFLCVAGRLNVLVENYTYPCYFPGQEIRIRIMKNDWLHKGAIVCPACRELCGQEFERAGKYCRGSEDPPPPNSYPHDELKCHASHQRPALDLFRVIVVVVLVYLF